MAIQCRCEAARINSVLWSLSLVSIVFILISTPLVQASTDDDIELQFYWSPATGNVHHYNVYLFIYSTPDSPGPSSEDDYMLVDNTFDTHGSDAPTLDTDTLYTLRDTLYELRGATEPIAIEDGKGYQIQVAAVDVNGTIGPRSEPSEIVWCDLNDPPVADNQSVTTNEDAALSITLTGSDPDGDTLTYTVVTNPSYGSLSGTAPDVTYTPNTGFSGSDSFTFKVNDGIVSSNTATVNITVNPAGIPVSIPPTSASPGGTVSVPVEIGDTTGIGIIEVDLTIAYDASILEATDATTLGTISEAWGEPTYSITPGQITVIMAGSIPLSGSGQFLNISFSVASSADIGSTSDLVLANVELNKNAIPVTLQNGVFTVTTPKYGDTSGDGLVSHYDADLVSQYVAGLIAFTPSQLIAGDVSGNGTVSSYDAGLIKQYAAGVIDTFPVEQDQLATANSSNAPLAAEASAGVEITAPDLTGRAGDNVTVLINISDVTGLGIIGVDFTLKYDASILTATGATTLGTVAESWDEPYFNVTPGQIVIPMSGIFPLTGSGSLVSISFHVSADTSVGSVSEFNIDRADLNEGGIPATIANGSFEVIPSNQPPVAYDQSVVTVEGTAVSITLTGDDPDGDTLTYAIVSNPSNGILGGTAPNMIYTPNNGFSDSFTFKVNDGTMDSNTAAVTISVNSPENVTAMILLGKFDYSYDKSTNETSVMVTWTNTGTSRLSLPLLMVIENTLPSSVYVTNADDTTPDGKPYYDYSDRVYGGKLDPGETSGAKKLIFGGPKNILRRMKFTFDVSCWAVIESSAAVESVASLSITVEPVVDSDSSSFLPPTEVPSGWHLISIPVKPIDTHPRAVLSSIDGKYSSVWAYDPAAGWSVYAPGLTSNLQTMEPGVGYWIKMEQEGTLDVEGDDPEQTAITLIGGSWNLVGYCSQDTRYAEDCMEHVADAINSVWGYAPDTGWSVYTSGSPGDLVIMKPWYGYWIKADQTCTWDVNNTSASAAPSAAAK